MTDTIAQALIYAWTRWLRFVLWCQTDWIWSICALTAIGLSVAAALTLAGASGWVILLVNVAIGLILSRTWPTPAQARAILAAEVIAEGGDTNG